MKHPDLGLCPHMDKSFVIFDCKLYLPPYDPIAQLVERRAFNPQVLGSIPSGVTINREK